MYINLLILSLASMAVGQFQCPSDGRHHLLPHETDCSKFYYCEYGERRNDARQCPKNTLFSYEKQVCDHPRNVICHNGNGGEPCDCPNGTTLPNGCPCNHSIQKLLPHESDCTKYYECNKGKKVLRECAPGQHFNSKLQICDHPSNAGCDPTCSGSNNDCPNGITFPNGCPCNHSIHQLLPHESNCAQYYQCERGEKILRDCAPGTHFNSKLQVCDHPSNAGCDPSCSGSNNDCPNGITFPNGCPCNHSIHQLLPHESNCAQYYQCERGEKILRDCAPGTHFNPKLQVCDHPSNAGCDPTCGEDNCPNGSTHPNGCPCNHNILQLLPHESNCAKFYQCVRGEKVIRECAPGTHFNSVLQVCDTPCNAGCDNSSCGEEIGGGTSGEAGGSNCSCTTEKPVCDNKCKQTCNIPHWPHETDCNKFWWCNGEIEVLTTCPEGLYFNEANQSCDFKCNVNCSKRKISKFTSFRLGLGPLKFN